MEPRRIIRTDIAASALAHVMLVALIILISEVHPFHGSPTETVSVDIVTPDELKDELKDKAPEPPAEPQLPKLDLTMKDKAEAAAPQQAKQAAPAPSPPQQQSSPEPQQAQQQQPKQPQPSPTPTPKQHEANAPPPQSQTPPQPQPQPQPQPAPPAFMPPEPDVTVKYGVMLGLPPELLPLPKDGPNDDGGDAKDSIAAKLPPEIIAEFRRHIRSCAKLPASIAPTDNVHIKLRAVLATDGTLARAPVLIEASASAKGPILMQSAMSALQACQPYKMLPPDLYQEWKVMDLPFTPLDFNAS